MPLSITGLVPTHGRESLRRTLASAVPQLLPQDEIVVIGDLRGGPLPRTEAICAEFGPQVRYEGFTDDRMTHGHSQLNHGMGIARGDYLTFCDDDDVWTDSAFAAMRAAATEHPGRPLLFRFRSYLGGLVFWRFAGLVAEATIGGHCACFPNDPARLGKWGDQYEGDFGFIVETLALWEPVEPVWIDHIIAIARPGGCS